MTTEHPTPPEAADAGVEPADQAVQERRNFLKGVGTGSAVAGVMAALPVAGALAADAEQPRPLTKERRKAAVAAEPNMVTYESIDRVAVITMRGPIQRMSTLEQLHDIWERYNKSDDRCAVLTGKDKESFGSGGSTPPPDVAEYLQMYYRGVPNHAVVLTKPLISAVAGMVSGGTLQLPLQSDMVIAAENTVFWYPEARFGITAGLISSIFMRVPLKVAMQLVMTAEPMPVKRFYEVGFVNEIVPVGKQQEVAMKYARQIADNAPLAIAWFKNLANRAIPKSPSELTAPILAEMQTLVDSDDYREALDAFKAGRNPRFQGK